jgi:hypothetical protein
VEKNLVPEIEGMTIVVAGDFNPAIMHPQWFASNGLIRDEDAKNAEIEVVHKRVSNFRTESFGLQVTDDRFSIQTEDPTMFLPLRDLAVGTFSILEHTPVRAFGLNRYEHIQMSSEADWHALGDYFVPKAAWNGLFERPGTKVVAVSGTRKGADDAIVELKIQPSSKTPNGVFLHLHEHYDIPHDANSPEAMNYLLKTLQGAWESFNDYWHEASTHLLSTCRENIT